MIETETAKEAAATAAFLSHIVVYSSSSFMHAFIVVRAWMLARYMYLYVRTMYLLVRAATASEAWLRLVPINEFSSSS